MYIFPLVTSLNLLQEPLDFVNLTKILSTFISTNLLDSRPFFMLYTKVIQHQGCLEIFFRVTETLKFIDNSQNKSC
jgi:hypothetical protein